MTRSRIDGTRMNAVIQEGPALMNVEQLNSLAATFVMSQKSPYAIGLNPLNANQNVNTYTPSPLGLVFEHEIFNLSTGTGVLVIKDPTGVTTLGSVNPGQKAMLQFVNGAWQVFPLLAGNGVQSVAAQQTIQQYTLLSAIVNAQIEAIAIPFAFKLNSVGFRNRTPASTAAKAATLTAQVAGVSVTGGVISLTTANQNVSGALTAGTSITAGNTGAAGATVGVVNSGVTAFVEGDGYIEYNLTNLSLLA